MLNTAAFVHKLRTKLFHKLDMGIQITLFCLKLVQMNLTSNIEEIKSKIAELALQHKATGDDLDDFVDSELIEQEAEQLVVQYSEAKGYLVNGFPTEKRLFSEEELEEDYFCRERYQLYIDTLATLHEDVAELTWCYVSSFWEDQFESKEEYIQNLRDRLDSGGFSDVTF
jgi:hypothetical protein